MISAIPSSLLFDYLLAEGVINDPEDTDAYMDWEGFLSNLPDGKDNIIGLYDVGFEKDSRDTRGTVIGRYRMQIRVVASTYDVGHAKVIELVQAIDSLNNETLTPAGSFDYFIPCLIRPTGPMFMGVSGDDTRRNYNWSINLEAHIKEISR